MSYTTVSGRASHVRREGESTEFRVGRQAVWIMSTPHLADGDLVSVVGHEKNGWVRAVAMRNDMTGLVSQRRLPVDLIQGAYPSLGCGALAVLALLVLGPYGLFFLPFTLPGAGFLLFVRYRGKEVDRAKAVLREMPISQASP
jgi:hypothetical protein